MTNPENVVVDETAGKKAKAPKVKKEKAPKAEKPAKVVAPKIERQKQNGVTRPTDDTKTGRVWAIADEVSAAKERPATRAEVLEIAKGEGINEATIATQHGKWRKFFGLKKEPKAAEAPAAETPAATDSLSPVVESDESLVE